MIRFCTNVNDHNLLLVYILDGTNIGTKSNETKVVDDVLLIDWRVIDRLTLSTVV